MIVNKAIPIEYPNNPDVYVDEYGLPFKERGLRGKAGSAPPFDLDKGAKGLPKVAGRMTSVSMAHTGATVGKKKDVSKVRPQFLLPSLVRPDKRRDSGFKWSTARSQARPNCKTVLTA